MHFAIFTVYYYVCTSCCVFHCELFVDCICYFLFCRFTSTFRNYRCSHVVYKDEHLFQEHDHPVKLSETKAYTWKSMDTFAPPISKRPKIEYFSLNISLLVLLTYFIFIREENSVDTQLGNTLYENFPEMEAYHLRVAIDQAKRDNMDASKFENRLKEIE